MANGNEQLQKFGIDALRESERYSKIASFNKSIAEREIERNRIFYEREFLLDLPVSFPHSYYLIDHALHTENIKHPLFRIADQIDARERSGATREGFQKFENLVTQQRGEENVLLWYSPAGKAGGEPPFDKIYLDSGRLYFCFTGENSESIHIDIKVNEDIFPIAEMLDFLEKQSGIQPTSQKENVLYNYLRHPFALNAGAQNLFSLLRYFGKEWKTKDNLSLSDTTVYTARRKSNDPETFSFSRIVEEIEKQLYSHKSPIQFIQPLNTIDYIGGKVLPPVRMTEEMIFEKYMEMIIPWAEKNGGTYTLYGCSTTSSIGNSLSSNPFQDLEISPPSIHSAYSTASRVFASGTVFESSESDRYEDYHCPQCKGLIPGELKGVDKKSRWTKICTNINSETGKPCGYRFNC